MKNLMKVSKKYLIFRNQAKDIFREIKKLKASQVFLDFSKVKFISRSFADEFLRNAENLERKNKKIEILNENLFISRLFALVKKKRNEIKKLIKAST